MAQGRGSEVHGAGTDLGGRRRMLQAPGFAVKMNRVLKATLLTKPYSFRLTPIGNPLPGPLTSIAEGKDI